MLSKSRSDVELSLLRSSLHASFRDDGRVAGSSSIGVVVTRDEVRLIAGDEFPHDYYRALLGLMTGEVTDLSDPSLPERIRADVAREMGGARIHGGPAYVFDHLASPMAPPGFVLTRSTERGAADAARNCPPNWSEDEWSDLLAEKFGPWVIALQEDGEVAAYCHTPGKVTSDGAEAGVWTHPAHRGEGLAAAVTAAWAQLLSAPDRVLFYSTDRDNTSSQRVAQRLGLRLFAWEWDISPGGWPEGDAWGHALADHYRGRYVPRVELETGDGVVGAAMRPEWFFRRHEEWDWWERDLLDEVTAGPVLDLGAGAGRVGLRFQDRRFEVTAVETSQAACRVCRRRGLRDVRAGDLNDPPRDRAWKAILLLCGNLGLGGSRDGVRRLLSRLAAISAPDAVLIGDTVDPPRPGAFKLRIRYKDEATPWWEQYNVPITEMADVVEGTGWVLDRHLIDRSDHAVLLRKAPPR